jgi:outer membrane protein assembly factor BamE (lipoprotein component of BamABCDE complex)
MRKIIVLAFLLAGCAGTHFEWDRAKQVRVGTTQEELVALMGGRPYAVKTRGDVEVWIWSYADATGGTRFTSFEVKNGKVSAVPNMSQFD